jgi:dTDP-4-dehydrorhamnose reductase
MLRLANERDTLRVIDDQIGGPTSADDLASALLTIVDRQFRQGGLEPGIFHFSNQGEASWADLAEVIMSAASAVGGVTALIERITTSEYITKARRPKNSRLDTRKIYELYGILARDWHKAIKDIVNDLGGRV